VPSVDWERFGALASFEVISFGVAAHVHVLRGDLDSADASISGGIALGAGRSDAFGVAVVRTADIQRSAMLGTAAGLAQRADEVLDELSGLGIDTVDEMRDALAMHAQGGRRIFTPLYYALLADAEAAHRDSGAARTSLRQAEQVAKATGEKVWDTQLSARKLTLRADSVRSDAMRG
jgi:hypothetical protein